MSAGIRPEHGGRVHRILREMKMNRDEIIDFSASINFLGVPASVREVLREEWKTVEDYPDPDACLLRDALASYLDVSKEYILAANGAAEALYLIGGLFAPASAFVPAPTFSEYAAAVRTFGGKAREPVILWPLDDGVSVLQEIGKTLEGCDLLFICNPNNPTGTLFEQRDLLALIRQTEQAGTTVIVDEAFLDFLPEHRDYSLAGYVGEYDNLLILRSLTKFFAMPGLRIGAVVGPQKLIDRLACRRDPWSVNAVAQLAGARALKDRRYIEKSRKAVAGERRFLSDRLSKLGLEVFPSPANFILIDLNRTGLTAPDLIRDLKQRGILLRDASGFPGLSPGHVRIAVRGREENLRLLAALKERVGGKG